MGPLDFRHFRRYVFAMLRTVAAVLITSVLALGCTATDKTPTKTAVTKEVPRATAPAEVLFHGDVEFTADERQRVLLAAEVWSIQTSGLASIKVTWDADYNDPLWMAEAKDGQWNLLGRLTSGMALVARLDANEDGEVLGVVAPSGGIHNPWRKPVMMVLVSDRLTSLDAWGAVSIHEFGHVLGIPHLGSPSAVMFPAYIRHQFSCLKKPDLAAFCDANECGNLPMYPCE